METEHYECPNGHKWVCGWSSVIRRNARWDSCEDCGFEGGPWLPLPEQPESTGDKSDE